MWLIHKLTTYPPPEGSLEDSPLTNPDFRGFTERA